MRSTIKGMSYSIHLRSSLSKRSYFSFSFAAPLVARNMKAAFRTPSLLVAPIFILESRRTFFQGGPPPETPPSSTKAQAYLKSKAAEVDARLEERRKDHQEYYGRSHGCGETPKPVPLFENAFIPGKFGMRRRLVVRSHKAEKEKEWDATERGFAVADAQATFFK